MNTQQPHPSALPNSKPSKQDTVSASGLKADAFVSSPPAQSTTPDTPSSSALARSARAPGESGVSETSGDRIEEFRTQPVEPARAVQLGGVATPHEILARGRRAYAHGEDGVALEWLGRLASQGLRYADVYYMMGVLEERRGSFDAAFLHLREAIRINPAYVEALLALASLHERRGEFDRSREYAERASQLSRPRSGGLDPTTRGKLANQQADLADALVEAGELREAIEEYRRALERCPTFHDIRYRLGIALRDAGLPAQAAREFARILKLHPRFLESQIQLGLTYFSMGRTSEAVKHWNAVLEKDPSRDQARMYLRLVRGSAPETDANAETRAELASSPFEQRGAPATPKTPIEGDSGVTEHPARATEQNPDANSSRGWTTTQLTGRQSEKPEL